MALIARDHVFDIRLLLLVGARRAVGHKIAFDHLDNDRNHDSPEN